MEDCRPIALSLIAATVDSRVVPLALGFIHALSCSSCGLPLFSCCDGAALGCSPCVVPAEAALCSQCSRLRSNHCGSAAIDSVGGSLPLRAEWEQSDERHSLFGCILLCFTLGHVNHSLLSYFYKSCLSS